MSKRKKAAQELARITKEARYDAILEQVSGDIDEVVKTGEFGDKIIRLEDLRVTLEYYFGESNEIRNTWPLLSRINEAEKKLIEDNYDAIKNNEITSGAPAQNYLDQFPNLKEQFRLTAVKRESEAATRPAASAPRNKFVYQSVAL